MSNSVNKRTVTLTIRPDIWADMRRWAGREHRSLSGQIEMVLSEYLERKQKEKEAEK